MQKPISVRSSAPVPPSPNHDVVVEASGLCIGGLHRRVELRGVAALFARPIARSLASAERYMGIDACGRQIHHYHPRYGVALEMRGMLQRRGADAGAQAKVAIVGELQCML